MSWELLPVDYTDAVWDGLKKYEPIENDDGTISLKDVTVYSNLEKSFFGAMQANRMNEALNTIMSMVENGTDLYEAFQIYFADQKALFKTTSDTTLEQYNSDMSALKSNATTTAVEFNTYVSQLKNEGDQAIESIKTNYEAEIAGYEKEQENIFNIWFEAMRDKLSQDAAGNLQSEIDDINNNRIQFSVTCPDVLLGKTITATNGVDTKTVTIDESLTVTFGFRDPGVYTLTDSLSETGITVNAYLYGLYPVTVKLGVINVTCPDAMTGKTITCTNGEKTYTRAVDSTKQVVFGVPDLGTWEITNNYTEEVIDVDVADYVSYDVTLHIATLKVNCDVSYAGETVSVTNGSAAYSEEVPDTGVVTFSIPVFGTWAVTNTKTTDAVDIDVNAYSEYTVQFGLVGIKVVCGNSQFVGETVTVTKGSTSYTKTVTESLEVTFELNGLGTWTVTNSKTSAAIETECTQYQTYNVALNLVTITATFTDEAFVGQTVTCEGASSETKVIGSDLSVSFSVDTGTYTLSNSLTSTTQTVNATEYTTYSVSFSVATIVVTCVTDDYEGMTITCTDGTTTLSKVVGEDLQVSFSVGLGSWILHNPVSDVDEEAISVTEYTTYNFTMKKLTIVTWENGSYDAINKMLEAHYAGTIDIADYWAVGDKRNISLNGTDYEFVIMDFDHYDLAASINGKTKAAVVIGMVDCYGALYQMNSSNTNSGGWTSSVMRQTTMNTMKGYLPTAIQNLAKQVKTKTSAGNKSTTINIDNDYCFLPSEIEVFGSTTLSVSGEGTQLEYYKTSSNRIKKMGTSNCNWCLRSPYLNGTVGFCYVNNIGNSNTDSASGARGVSFCLCI